MTVGLLAVLLVYSPGPGWPRPLFPGISLACHRDNTRWTDCRLLLRISKYARRQTILICFICGAAGHKLRNGVVMAGGDVYLGVFCGTILISLLALVLCPCWKIPVALPLVAASVQFIPGYYIILCLQGMAMIISMGQSVPYTVVATTITNGLLSLFVAASIVMGTLLPLLIFGKDRRWY